MIKDPSSSQTTQLDRLPGRAARRHIFLPLPLLLSVDKPTRTTGISRDKPDRARTRAAPLAPTAANHFFYVLARRTKGDVTISGTTQHAASQGGQTQFRAEPPLTRCPSARTFTFPLSSKSISWDRPCAWGGAQAASKSIPTSRRTSGQHTTCLEPDRIPSHGTFYGLDWRSTARRILLLTFCFLLL